MKSLGPGLSAVTVGVVALIGLTVIVDDAEGMSTEDSTVCVPTGRSIVALGQWDTDQMTNAAAIVAVGVRRGIDDHGVRTALTAAMTESRLRNLDHGDRDSLGLFQMRPSMGWGTPDQLTNPTYASTKFYEALVAVPGWHDLTPAAAAQAVERSAFPERYVAFERDAGLVLAGLRGMTCRAPERLVASAADPRAQVVIEAALGQLGVPYAWGGGTASGPSAGSPPDAGVVGFDCSGLALFSYAAAGMAIPHQTQAIWAAFQPAIRDRDAVLPGDLVLLSDNGRPDGIHHVAIYLGDGRVVHAPQSGDVVRIVEGIWQSPYWSKEFIGVVRPS